MLIEKSIKATDNEMYLMFINLNLLLSFKYKKATDKVGCFLELLTNIIKMFPLLKERARVR